MKQILWLSDLHLDGVSDDKRQKFYHRLSNAPGEVVVITGDISDGRHLCGHLLELSEACGTRPLYFVLGNHDFYCSSLIDVRMEVESLCRKQKRLHHLGNGEIIPLGDGEALVGHDGWADGRAGYGSKSRVSNPDFSKIDDFKGRKWQACFNHMRILGQQTGRYFDRLLPSALRSYRNVWVATHVPPFTQAARWNGKMCNYDFQPHFSNMSLGYTLWAMSTAFPQSTMKVLAGHTHSEVSMSLRHNLSIHTAGASPKNPRYQNLEHWY